MISSHSITVFCFYTVQQLIGSSCMCKMCFSSCMVLFSEFGILGSSSIYIYLNISIKKKTLYSVWYLIMQISYSGVLYHVLLRLLYVLSFILTFLCSCVLLPRNPSSNIPFWPYSSWPSPLSFSFSLPLFSLSPSLESHMVSLKWSAIKRGAQGAHCPHLFSCSAWAVPLLVETVSCDILCQP